MQTDTSLIKFNETDHTYWKDNRRVPSVTECLKSVGLIEGMEFVADEAVMRGIRIHRMIHFYNKGTLDMATVTEDIEPALVAYQDFERATGFVATSYETRVLDAQIWVAGTYDVRGFFPDSGNSVIIDLKSGVVKPWTALQLAGYARCMGDPYARRFGLSLKDSDAKLIEFLGYNDASIFLSAVAIHNWKLNTKRGKY